MENRKFVTGLAAVLLLATSFYLGTLVDQDTVLDEVMSEITENHYTQPTEEELLQGAIDGMIETLGDPYTSYFDYEEYVSYQTGFQESYVGIGVTVVYQNDTIVVEAVKAGSPAEQAGILPNDIFVEVNGESIVGVNFYEAVQEIIGEEGTDVSIGLLRQGVEDVITLTMTRAVIENSSVTFRTFEQGEELIGYIEVTTFGDVTANLFEDALIELEEQEIDGLIIDLRNNGGGHLYTVIDMLQQFLIDNDKQMFSTEYYANGVLYEDLYFGAQDEQKPYDIVTLVNENSASASEVFASAMQEHGGYTVIGTTTFGKGTMQTDVALELEENDSLHLTIGKWLTSDGNWVHFDGGTDGVTPDIESPLEDIEMAYKLFLFDEEVIEVDTVDYRIENLQVILNALGHNLRTDGYFDQATLDVLNDLRTENSMPTTNNVDEDVLVIINEFLTNYKNDSANDSQLATCLDYFSASD